MKLESLLKVAKKAIPTVKRYAPAALTGLFMVAAPQLALAAGVDTGESGATSIQTWLNEWIPIGCAIAIVVSAFAWMLHLIPMSWAVRVGVGLIVIGSASYLVSLTGVGS